ncbi:MAG: hypothetical protein Ct9H300mP14_04900 [Gammaproteobacteria bacterium]|nr:MAG: hypothetical protein Ct9H300mP14_04900 [Gammaproteobacteria bacterium]
MAPSASCTWCPTERHALLQFPAVHGSSLTDRWGRETPSIACRISVTAGSGRSRTQLTFFRCLSFWFAPQTKSASTAALWSATTGHESPTGPTEPGSEPVALRMSSALGPPQWFGNLVQCLCFYAIELMIAAENECNNTTVSTCDNQRLNRLIGLVCEERA